MRIAASWHVVQKAWVQESRPSRRLHMLVDHYASHFYYRAPDQVTLMAQLWDCMHLWR